MKNTLLAVLIISACHGPTQAQSIAFPTSCFINFPVTFSHTAKYKEVTAHIVIDGAVATDKSARDFKPAHTITDGAGTTDKLADDLVASLKQFEEEMATDKPVPGLTPVKPRPLNKRTGWLQ